jgi:hypothetical protein
MEVFGKNGAMIGIALSLMSSMHGDTYDADFANIFIDNNTDYEVMVRFFSDHYEQQQYPMQPDEHRMVRLKIGVMKKLFSIKVTLKDPETGEMIMGSIEYTPDTGINRLKIRIKRGIDLSWGYENEGVKYFEEGNVEE